MDDTDEPRPQLVVLGSSAGGIDALSAVMEPLGPSFSAPIVVAQHLDPRRESHLAEILGRRTKLAVISVEGPVDLEAGKVYVLPADHDMDIAIGRIVTGGPEMSRPMPSIDRILASASETYGEGVTAVILSGTGSDGAAGARLVKAAGGTVVTQNPETAMYPAMPMAIAPPLVDIVADAGAIGPLLEELTVTPRFARRGDNEKRILRRFLDELRDRSGIDFGSYKPGTILRRLQRRMLATGSADLRRYVAYVHDHPEEYLRLTSSFLIKVTEFFRDADLYDYLRDDVLPRLIEDARTRDRELRLWSAGCATGEEAYSLAILVAEALGDELGSFNVRIFATDVDLDAITFARRGVYPAAALEAVPQKIRERYFSQVGTDFEVGKLIRGMTVFGQHDLGQRAPFPRVDLAMCRNVLIYFTTDLQVRALQLFAFALRDGGYLVLGKAESTSPLPEHFVLAQPRLKVYRRQGARILIPPARIRDLSSSAAAPLPVARPSGWVGPSAASVETSRQTAAERSENVLLRLPVGIVVVDHHYDIQLINTTARRQFGIHGQAIGQDFVHVIDGRVAQPIKAAIDAALRGHAGGPTIIEIDSSTAERTDQRSVEIATQPVLDDRSADDRVIVVATDVTAAVQSRREMQASLEAEEKDRHRATDHARHLAETNAQLLAANQELTAANSELRGANEELQVANEEVQAATEEVETLNEELQATNEELETLNEELQATVEELNTTNDDLEARTRQLQETAIALEATRGKGGDGAPLLALVDVVGDPILVVDRRGHAMRANQQFRDLLGDPARLELRDPDGNVLAGEQDPRIHAAVAPFDRAVVIGGATYRVVGQPLEGIGGSYGALIFKPA